MASWLEAVCFDRGPDTSNVLVGSNPLSKFMRYLRKSWLCIEERATNTAEWDAAIALAGAVFDKDVKLPAPRPQLRVSGPFTPLQPPPPCMFC